MPSQDFVDANRISDRCDVEGSYAGAGGHLARAGERYSGREGRGSTGRRVSGSAGACLTLISLIKPRGSLTEVLGRRAGRPGAGSLGSSHFPETDPTVALGPDLLLAFIGSDSAQICSGGCDTDAEPLSMTRLEGSRGHAPRVARAMSCLSQNRCDSDGHPRPRHPIKNSLAWADR